MKPAIGKPIPTFEPPYFIDTNVPDRDCHNYIRRWRQPCERFSRWEGDSSVICEVHEYDALDMCNLLNQADPHAETFYNECG